MFDASMKTVSEKKKYNKFLKQLKSKGYIMLQKSVYYSFSRSSSLFVAEIKNIRKIDRTNLTYVEPHRIIINDITFLAFNYSNEIFIENLSNNIKLSDLENYLKSI